MRETKEILEGGLRIDRMWWAAVKVSAIVAVSVLAAIATALAILYPLGRLSLGRAARRIIRDEEFHCSINRTTLHSRVTLQKALGHNASR